MGHFYNLGHMLSEQTKYQNLNLTLGQYFYMMSKQYILLCHESFLPVNYCWRYFGLTKLVVINETDPTSFDYELVDGHMWANLASPLVILLTYYVLAVETRELFKPKVRIT